MLRRGKVILHEAYFANMCLLSGNVVPYTEKHEWINSVNLNLEKYYSKFKELTSNYLKVVCLRSDETHIADPNHKFGFAPTHFTRSYYTKIFDLMELN
jgi:hypothetical protein